MRSRVEAVNKTVGDVNNSVRWRKEDNEGSKSNTRRKILESFQPLIPALCTRL